MGIEVRFAPAVASDVEAASRWYDEQSPGLGGRFLDAVMNCLERVRRSPELSQRIQGRFRRCLVRRFPYAVYYEYNRQTVTIYGIVHTSRDPAKWQKRLP